LKIYETMNARIEKMNKEKSFIVEQKELNKLAEQIIGVINKYHSQVVKQESLLKAAIIDLTEVPTMQPQMQRIAYLTALKDAASNIQKFLETSSR
jgi:N12 class adenine-specific DNA methylase